MSESQSAQKPLYLPGLNGIRALAAMSVVMSHSVARLAQFGLTPRIPGLTASYGVTVFFALSGFLITLLLLMEKERQPIAIGKFYKRRVLRIWPLYYLYLAICVAIAFATVEVSLASLAGYVFLAANIPYALHATLPLLAHYWSLGVEEQFYLFWPWLVGRVKPLLGVVVVLSAAMIVVRVAVRLLLGNSSPWFSILEVTRFDCMGIGAVGAILFYRHKDRVVELLARPSVQYSAWAVLALMAASIVYIPLIGQDVVAVLTVVIIVGQSTGKRSLLSLEFPAANYLGKISYGLYVIHPLVIYLGGLGLKDVEMNESIKEFLAHALVVVGSIAIAHLSYRYYERPFMKIKNRLAVVSSTATRPG